MFDNTVGKVKINRAAFGAVLCFLIGTTGCANNNGAVKKSMANKASIAKPVQQTEVLKVVVASQPRKTAGSNEAELRRTTKDQHHIEFDRKRMLYNQQWLARQEAEAQQQAQRLKYQQKYERDLQQQTRLQQQRKQTQQRRVQQQQLVLAQQQANANQQYHQDSRYQQQQAQIEAQQQRYNWKQDGTWKQAQAGWAQQQARIQQASRAQQIRMQQAIRAQQAARRGAQQQARYASAARQGSLAEHLSNAAIARTYHKVRYDGRYIPISYPMGDVPANMGVCTDTLIRSYRRLGIDLQRLVHEDISRAFHVYPNLAKWGLSGPDPNIDHRRVHNLKVFFSRHGQRLPVTGNPADYRPGDIVTWHLGGDQEHIGLVVNRRSPVDPRRYMIVHNIAKGDRMEDILFTMPITGHYRYLPGRSSTWLAKR